MKKSFAILLVSVLAALGLVALAGCSVAKPTPTDVARSTLDAIKSQDLDTLKKNYSGDTSALDVANIAGDVSGMDLSNLSEEELALFQEVSKVMTAFDYELGEEAIDGETATVEATITTYDLGKVFNEAMSEYFTDVISAAFSGEEMDQQAMTKLFVEKFKEKSDALTEKTHTATTTLHLTQVEGDWKMDDFDATTIDAILGGMQSGVQDFVDNLGSLAEAA